MFGVAGVAGVGLHIDEVVIIIILSFFYIQYAYVDVYMDEIYHIPQAQSYCNHNFTYWDDKITTFPGLYLQSYGMKTVANAIIFHITNQSISEYISCTPTFLRLCNAVTSFLLYCVLKRCRHKLQSKVNDSIDVALLLFLYPLNAFYYCLYYTDTASTFFLVLTYYISLCREGTLLVSINNIMLLFASSMAVLVRQTNAIWLLFFIGVHSLTFLEVTDKTMYSMHNIFRLIRRVIETLPLLLLLNWSLIVPIAMFLAFVFYNKGVVVGDREHHAMVYHLSMPLHALALTGALESPLLLSSPEISQFLSRFMLNRRNILIHVGGIIATSYILYYCTYSHPFLLSDNRHYTFYLWKRFLNYPIVRISLAPVYYLLIVVNAYIIGRYKQFVWCLMYLAAVLVTLIPAALLEFRYFTPAVIIAILNLPPLVPGDKWKLLMSLIICSIVSIVTIYIFIYKPYTWHDGTIARFMF